MSEVCIKNIELFKDYTFGNLQDQQGSYIIDIIEGRVDKGMPPEVRTILKVFLRLYIDYETIYYTLKENPNLAKARSEIVTTTTRLIGDPHVLKLLK